MQHFSFFWYPSSSPMSRPPKSLCWEASSTRGSLARPSGTAMLVDTTSPSCITKGSRASVGQREKRQSSHPVSPRVHGGRWLRWYRRERIAGDTSRWRHRGERDLHRRGGERQSEYLDQDLWSK